ncbi:thiosulfate/3-mercaptopyruvate sulfurtransferase [Kushneria avicenniae]|uniref:Thiosulfate/3-mercaptopyruvate sulfurtransferase n=1 Tax=Kushneria avicenniae TaxID=402385 RepID=A0A1I1IKH2_9GAMM|nr:sulfurtransferase [Kushneria avicenniae]SFC34748.1 thiosulfate/3-mercaptopyruvate sulfurtransferase [Kushneria avicenniae]
MSQDEPRFPRIVEPRALSEHLEAPDLLIIDVPANAQSYQEGHVPGAVLLDYRRLLSGQAPVANDVPDEKALSTLFSELGLTPQTHVIVYDDEGGGWAGRLAWTLTLLGHDQWSYLNGGIHAWRAENLPESRDATMPTPTRYQARIQRPELIIRREELIERLDDPGLVIWDARSPEEYDGVKGNNQRLGHIPGAVNLEWTETMDKSRHLRMRDLSELVTELAALEIDADGEIATHCQSHHRSGLTWMIGYLLGYNIRAYPGSWQEWGNRDDTPIET